MPAIEPLAVGVCSWSLQPKNIPELKRLMDRLGIDVVQIACGDPHHAAWDEGDDMPAAAKAGQVIVAAKRATDDTNVRYCILVLLPLGAGQECTRPAPKCPGFFVSSCRNCVQFL